MNVATKKEFLAEGWQAVRQEPYKHDRWLIVPRVLAVLIVMAGLALWAGHAFAYPISIASAGNGQVVITVYSEDCQLTDVVANLPNRATWEQRGKTFEGCVGVQPAAEMAMFYFKDDKSVAVVPLQAFVRVVGS